MARARLEAAERVDPSGPDPPIELLPLDRGEAARLPVFLGPGEIDVLMGSVEITHDQDGDAPLFVLLEEVEDAAVERELEGDTAIVPELAVAVREVSVDDDEAAKGGAEEAGLGVERRVAE